MSTQRKQHAATAQHRVEDVTTFLGQVKTISEKWLPSDEIVGPWFRGQGNAEWSLVPKFYREFGIDRATEDEIREEFAQRGPAYCGSSHLTRGRFSAMLRRIALLPLPAH